MLDALAGYDRAGLHRSAEAGLRPPWAGSWTRGVKGLRIGLPRGISLARAWPPRSPKPVLRAGQAPVKRLGATGGGGQPSPPWITPCRPITSSPSAEASSNLARFDGVQLRLPHRGLPATWTELYLNTRSEGFGPEVKRRILLGTYVLSAGYYDAYYKKALQVRTLVMRDIRTGPLEQFDALLGPGGPHHRLQAGGKDRRLPWRCTWGTSTPCR